MDTRRTGAALAAAEVLMLLTLVARRADALDAGTIKGEPVQLDVTETTIVAQHFDARASQRTGQIPASTFEDSDWGNWLNRLNAALRWDRFTVGLRLDSALYWNRPVDNAGALNYPLGSVALDNESRFRNSIYPAKLWVTYAAPGVEVTAGDSYAQFGRGLTLSMRKIDELGIDTTVRGVKVQVSRDPYALTAVAGLANPARVDEATGRALWATSGDIALNDSPAAVFGSDRVLGLELQAGRGLPVTLGTRLVRFSRCAPYAYAADESQDFSGDQTTFTFGSCNSSDVDKWLRNLSAVPRGLQASDITMAGQSIEIPTLWGHGKLYLEGVVQQRRSPVPQPTTPNGNALYGALSVDFGPASTTVEVKSNRNFYTVAGAVDGSKASELSLVTYSFLPPAESFNMLDTEGTGDFNACVNGVRVREDVTVNKNLLVYGQGIGAYSLTEGTNGNCDEMGHVRTPGGIPAASVEDTVWEGMGGFEYTFDEHLSHAFVSLGARDDTLADGDFQYREQHFEYSVAKFLGGPWSLEVQGRYRHRLQKGENLDRDAGFHEAWWSEGENYVALRIVPKWVLTHGFEFTNLLSEPLLYFNGAVTYKMTSSSNVRVFVGQQRGAFRCASGVCRYFPPFEGARAELTLRF